MQDISSIFFSGIIETSDVLIAAGAVFYGA